MNYRLRTGLNYCIHIFLTLLFPYAEHVRILEKITPEHFTALATKPIDSLPNITSLFNYNVPIVQQAIWALKYEGNRKIAKLFAICLYDTILEKISEENMFQHFTDPILIPLPISKERRCERGWNQTELMCHELEIVDRNKNFLVETKILEKIKHTQPQTKLSRKDRLHNLKNCFHITHSSLVKNKNIILLDDVTTTGSTIEEARQTLLAAGAKRVIGFTVAH